MVTHIHILQIENDKDYLELIRVKLERLLFATKERNNFGYLDQFEQQFEYHCIRVAQALGGRVAFDAEGPVFSFVPHVPPIRPSNPGLKKEELLCDPSSLPNTR